MITIYLWSPPGKTADSGETFGHISMELSDETYISFWPSEDIVKARSQKSQINSHDDDEESYGRHADKSLGIY